jgi:hypothetical protein
MERIINSLSGYKDFIVKISFEEQIKANLAGRLNARIREIPKLTECLHPKFCDCKSYECKEPQPQLDLSVFVSREDDTIQPKVNKVNKICSHVCSGIPCEWNALFQERILEEMTKTTRYTKDRINFLNIYRMSLSSILEEMRVEFVPEYIDLVSFDLYFRKAMMDYDCS